MKKKNDLNYFKIRHIEFYFHEKIRFFSKTKIQILNNSALKKKL